MKKKCRRKHYALVDPIKMAMQGAAFIHGPELESLRKLNKDAIEAFFRGTATIFDWRTIADMHNLAETMAKKGVGPEVLDACAAVDAALSESRERHERTGRIGMTGPQLQSLRHLYEYYDLQCQSIPRSELEKWGKKTADSIRSAHPDVKVFI